jgi:hypothetical protein
VSGREFVLLLDGEEVIFLGVDPTVTAETREDLVAWASSNVATACGARGAETLLSLEGLLTAASTGIVGSAAWSVFPAAGRWLSERRHHAETLSLTEVSERMRECLSAMGVDAANLDVSDVHQARDGQWIGEFTGDDFRFRVTADATGEILRVRRGRSSG